jgi:O-antigen/teichoic acid export membrane protein
VRFIQDPEFRARRGQVVGSALACIAALAAGLSALMVWQGDAVAQLLLPGRHLGWAVRLMAAGALFDLLTVQPMSMLQADQRSGRYVAVNLGRFALGLALNLALVAFWGLGLKGILLSTLVSAGSAAVFLHLCLWREERPALGRAVLADLLRFGLPFVPGGLFLFILNNGDRYFLTRLAPPDQVGLYALGYKLGTVILFLFVNPVMMNWSAMMVEIAARPDGPAAFGRMFTFVATVYLAACAAFSLLGPAMLSIVAGPEYQQAAGLIPWVCLAYFFWTASLFFDTPFYLARRTAAKPLLLGAATVLNLFLYATMIPRYGMYGAAWATVLSFAAFAALTWVVSRRIMDVPYAWGRVGAMLAASAAAVAAGILVPMPSPAAGLGWRVALSAALAALGWWGILPAVDRAAFLRSVAGLLHRPPEAGHGT